MKKYYPVIVERNKKGVFIVGCPLFTGYRNCRHSIEEALKNIREAIKVCMGGEPSGEEQVIFS